MNAELERLRPLSERLNDAIRFLDALILNRRFSRVEYEGLAGVRGLLRDLSVDPLITPSFPPGEKP